MEREITISTAEYKELIEENALLREKLEVMKDARFDYMRQIDRLKTTINVLRGEEYTE